MLLQIAVYSALFLGVGAAAARADRNEQFAKRIAATIAIAVVFVFAMTVVRGELLRFAPGSSDGDEIERSVLP